VTSVLGTRAARGSLWLGLVNLVSKGSQVVVTLALAAFLTEDGLGTVALVVSVVNIGQVVQAMGVYDVLSRTTRDPGVVAGTVLTMSVGVAVALTAALVLAASPVATVLGVPGAAPLVQLAALSLPFSAAGGVQLALMHRDLDFRRRLLPDAGSALLGGAVTFVLAAGGTGPVALVIGLLCTAIAQPLLAAVVGVRPRPGWDRDAAREAGGWIAVVGPGAVVAILLVNVDYLAIGHVLGPAAVGVYSLAFRIAWVPYITVAIVLAAVMFPVCTKLVREGRADDLAGATARFTRATLVVAGGLYLLVALLADRVVLLGDRWAAATPVLVLLCAYGLGISLLQIWYQALKAAGHARHYLALEVGHLVMLLAAVALSVGHGMVAVAVAQAAVAWLVVAMTWWTMARHGLAFPISELVRMTVGVAVAAGMCGGAALLAQPLVGPPDSMHTALAEGAVLVCVYTGCVLVTQRGVWREVAW
jgi:O-antigen/teichoic acid export membrane protein